MNILLTGGAGYVGSHTCVALVQAGFTPVIVDDFSNSHPAVLQRLQQITGQAIACGFQGCCKVKVCWLTATKANVTTAAAAMASFKPRLKWRCATSL